ncbi:hypothetical protein E5678_05410 [Hydrogenophaga sp. PAMC20947]|nr:hypothetical protein E5678_05410 [Hydrogenophaga sp. PAMC20947]
MSMKLQRHRVWVHALAVFLGVLMPLGPALAQTISALTPLELRGVWYPKSEQGAQQCARVQREGLGELHPGTLQITHTQLLDLKGMGQHTVVFVTESRPRKRNIWRLQGLVDVYPYEAPKVLETYIMELDKKELRWFKRSFDGVAERVDSFVYERCV